MFEQKLPSKKNQVYKREYLSNGEKRFAVEKEFSDDGRFFTELKVGRLLEKSGLHMPALLDVQDPAENRPGKLVYEYIEGSVALDALSFEVISLIIRWLKRFYELTLEKTGEQMVLGDIHLRNFIYSTADREIYGFDFEEARAGAIEEDAARLFLFITTYEPEYSERNLELAGRFLNEAITQFNLDRSRFFENIFAEAVDMAKRRGKEVKTELILPVAERAFK